MIAFSRLQMCFASIMRLGLLGSVRCLLPLMVRAQCVRTDRPGVILRLTSVDKIRCTLAEQAFRGCHQKLSL